MEAAARGPGTRCARRSTALALRLGAALHRVGRRAGWGVAFTPTPRPSATVQGALTPKARHPPCCRTLPSPIPTSRKAPAPTAHRTRLCSRKLPRHTVPRLSEGLRAGPSEAASGFAARSRGTQAHGEGSSPIAHCTWCPSATGESPEQQDLLPLPCDLPYVPIPMGLRGRGGLPGPPPHSGVRPPWPGSVIAQWAAQTWAVETLTMTQERKAHGARAQGTKNSAGWAAGRAAAWPQQSRSLLGLLPRGRGRHTSAPHPPP